MFFLLVLEDLEMLDTKFRGKFKSFDSQIDFMTVEIDGLSELNSSGTSVEEAVQRNISSLGA
jgi:hypothetical protein